MAGNGMLSAYLRCKNGGDLLTERNTRIVDLYVNQRKTTGEIAEIVRLSSKQIRNILRDSGVDITERRRINGYQIDANFFKQWSPEMAYVLGFVLTDGCVIGNTFSISQKDPTILARINDVMNSNYPIRKRKNGKSFLHTLIVNRKTMVEDLKRLGITESKSLTVEFPDVPSDYLPHFIRGVIDGDGWVHAKGYAVIVTSGSPFFAYYLHEVFNAQGFNGRIVKQSGAYRVWVSGKEDVKRMGHWLYKSPGGLLLERKRERFKYHTKRDAVKCAS